MLLIIVMMSLLLKVVLFLTDYTDMQHVAEGSIIGIALYTLIAV